MLETKIILGEGSPMDKKISELEKEASAFAGNNWAKAIECLKTIKELRKNAGFLYSFESYLRLPNYLQRAGRIEEALLEFEELIIHTPNRVLGMVNRKKEHSDELYSSMCKRQEYLQLSKIYTCMQKTYEKENESYKAEYYNDLATDFEEKSEELAYYIDKELDLIWSDKQKQQIEKQELRKLKETIKQEVKDIDRPKPFTRREIRQLAIKNFDEINNINNVSGNPDEFNQISKRHAAYQVDLIKDFSLDDKAEFLKIYSQEVEVQTLILRNKIMLMNIKNIVGFDYLKELREIGEARDKLVQRVDICDQMELLDYWLVESKSASGHADQMQEKFNKHMQPIKNKFIGLQIITFIVVFFFALFLILKIFK